MIGHEKKPVFTGLEKVNHQWSVSWSWSLLEPLLIHLSPGFYRG